MSFRFRTVKNPTANWKPGDLVQIDFLRLSVLGRSVSGLSWLLEGKAGSFFSFEPYHGLQRANPCEEVQARRLKEEIGVYQGA